MITAVIIEDEFLARKRLKQLIVSLQKEITIIAELESISQSTNWFAENKHPDIVFLDIHLADGNSFNIFNTIKINSFIIFTTAFDEYALKAFELNSLDYLLKPINIEKLEKSIEKYTSFKTQTVLPLNYKDLLHTKNYKERFLASVGSKIHTIEVSNISYFYISEKSTFCKTFDNKLFALDNSLDTIETLLNPKTFFRINRQYIVSLQGIERIERLTKSRILLYLKPDNTEQTVSSHKTSEFKDWLDS